MPIAMPITIFNIRIPQSEPCQDRFVNEVADDGKTSDLVASEPPFASVGLTRLDFVLAGMASSFLAGTTLREERSLAGLHS